MCDPQSSKHFMYTASLTASSGDCGRSRGYQDHMSYGEKVLSGADGSKIHTPCRRDKLQDLRERQAVVLTHVL